MTFSPDGALNFRQTLPGLFRSGNLSRLSEPGKQAIQNGNFARILDLRTRAERVSDAPPFLGTAGYLNLSVLPYRHRALNEATAAATCNADIGRALLEHGANQVVAVLGAILDAPRGPVLIHCHAGKDRTGLISALCGELAGQSREQIGADYAASGPALTAFYAEQRRRKTPEQWARLEPFVPSQPQDVLRPLAFLDEAWGGTEAYLNAHGFGPDDSRALAQRLLGV
ncbi:tyrosine-protein phosphatase [Deinococcus aquaedulcis]|uniref:tyrosine-protein phosphatase n=1 Tax=Deinococcus aquaedulcis TaxID=2840455 RepID=UPI001C83AF2E|nr:tyrosine-protein phosphatase [Deinococcus aquaedulcis]